MKRLELENIEELQDDNFNEDWKTLNGVRSMFNSANYQKNKPIEKKYSKIYKQNANIFSKILG